MRTLPIVLVAALALAACKKDKPSAGPSGPASTAEADALWALAPEGARGGVVASPRAMAMLEGGMITARTWLAKLPELAPLAADIDASLPFGANTKLADLGLTRDKAGALFMTGDGMIAILPVANRDTFLAKTMGTKGADVDKVGEAVCKPVKDVYACATSEPLLATLGKGDLQKQLALAGARGDLELVGIDLPLGGSEPGSIAAVAQLARGAVVVRGTMQHGPTAIKRFLAAPNKPRTDPKTAAGFVLFDLRPFLAGVPDKPIFANVTLGQIARSVAGPLTMTMPAGELAPDATLPLSDPAPFTALVGRCTEIPFLGEVASVENGTCHFDVPGLGTALAIDVWVDGKSLRIGKQGSQVTGKAIAMSPAGTEIANGEWSLAFWGRGTLIGPSPVSSMAANAPPAELARMIRGMTLVNELGMAVRIEGDSLKFVWTMRTLFANPDEVVARLLAIPLDDIAAGRAGDAAEKISKGAPRSNFAADHAAGHGGLIMPTGMVGMISAIVIPMLMDTMKKQRRSEAEVLLNRIGASARIAYTQDGAYPEGEAPLTPSVDCCTQNHASQRKCGAVASDWATKAWRALEFEIDEPSFFQYSYRSDGKTFTATAVGDLDCDGNKIAYELRGASANGTPTVTFTPPPPNTD